MTADFKIKLNGIVYTEGWILNNFKNLNHEKYSDSAGIIFEFLYKWFTGEEIFEALTSGSTGVPKKIFIRRQQMILSARSTISTLNLKPGDRAALCISPGHIGGLMMLARSLVGNLQLTVVEPTGNPFEKQAADETFDFIALVPLQLENMIKDEKSIARLNGVKAVIVGGGPLSASLEAGAQKITAPIYQTFGMTETVSHIALRRINGATADKHYTVLPGVKISQDEHGCLVIESEITGGQKLVTNDVVELTAPDKFYWIGRADNIINSGGVKVNPEKVECAISEIITGSIDKLNFFVAGLPDNSLGERVVAVFERSLQRMVDKEALLKELRKKLSRYEIPKDIYFVDELIRTSSGKISRFATLTLIQSR